MTLLLIHSGVFFGIFNSSLIYLVQLIRSTNGGLEIIAFGAMALLLLQILLLWGLIKLLHAAKIVPDRFTERFSPTKALLGIIPISLIYLLFIFCLSFLIATFVRLGIDPAILVSILFVLILPAGLAVSFASLALYAS